MNAKPAIGWLNADGDVPLINDVSVVLKAQADKWIKLWLNKPIKYCS